MKRIRFSKCMTNAHNGEEWAKISNRKVGDEFTTFRAYSISKHTYYESMVKQDVEIESFGHMCGTATLMKVEVKLHDQVTDEEIKADTFPDATREMFDELMIRFYKRPDIVLLKLTMAWKTVAP